MLTQCPSCQTVFRVTGAILKMGHGQVRCGKCRTQFDAIEAMLDDEDEEIPERESEAVLSEAKADAAQRGESDTEAQDGEIDDSIEAREPQFAEDVTLEGASIEISGVYRIPPEESPDHTAQVMHEHVVIDRESRDQGDDHDSIEFDLSHEPAARDIEQQLDPAMDDGEPVAAAADHLLEDVDGRGRSAEQGTAPLSQRIWGRHHKRAHDAKHSKIAAELDAFTRDTLAPANEQPKRTRWWTVASIALIVMLLAQAMHHHRDELVRHPKLGPTVTRIYHALGLTLQPQWELQAYELQQWGVLSDPAAPDTLRVRASITNRATFSQPYPLIKLALQDRWGAPVGVRAFEPNEYLPAETVNGRLLASKQRANAEIVIVDPGADAVGFQLHACLKYAQATVCSDDLPGAR
jgi:predicted Zn finger-like uncharacterized protein